MNLSKTRNFCIIAHIDHGKSTLADRILELTGAVDERSKKDQYLDKMDLERERGITIKAQTARLPYTAANGETYTLNLIDTPGHVDFNYEVERALEACEGAVLLVDATQGVQAQTLANAYLAINSNLEIIPVLNKIDVNGADVDSALQQIEEVLGLDTEDALQISAKTGQGVDQVLEAVVRRIPPPKAHEDESHLRALIFDSWYDTYRGAIVLVRMKSGEIRKGMKVDFMATDKRYEVSEVGAFSPEPVKLNSLTSGDVGYVICTIKSVHETKVGDTITAADDPAKDPLPGFRVIKPMVFCGVFPTEPAQYDELRDSMDKLILNDSSFVFEPETSEALGFGFRCGFLGLLHMEIIQERLEREYDLDIVTTAPTVVYRVSHKDGHIIEIDNPAHLPPAGDIAKIEEPYIKTSIHVPQDFVGPVMKLCQDRRGEQQSLEYAGPGRIILNYLLPMAEVLFDFFDKLKSVSKGYASMDYEIIGHRPNDLVRLDILVNGEPVDALFAIVHRDSAYHIGTELTRKLKELIPRQQYQVAVQAAIGSRVVSRTNVKALRKNVTAKCYGGDITRKRKLLEKQKEGKKRMKAVGKVEIPQEAFLSLLKIEDR
ncbi:MAG: elongation factor 4 [Deltaproteobacteria bacterium]|nr:elongation factor 4 [Deltaproteobacteria bacterium]MBN2670200.1 elongation factor 4 [Deltaproteobacteria bacterium]